MDGAWCSRASLEASADRRRLEVSSEAVEPETEETALWRAYRTERSQAAREALFGFYFPFARKIAMRHFRRNWAGDVEFPDVSQFACAGLLEALDRFDPDRGVPFRAYAARRISGSILDGVSQANEVRGQVSFRKRLRRERAQSLSTADPDSLSQDQALKALVEMAVGLAVGFMLEGTGLYREAEAPDPAADAYESLVWKQAVRRLAAEVEALPPRERSIIHHHYMNGMSFEQIGALLGVSKGRISQLHRAAIGALRSRMTHSDDFKLER